MKKVMVISALIATASFFSVQTFWDFPGTEVLSSRTDDAPTEPVMTYRAGCLDVDPSALNSSNHKTAQTRTKKLLKKILQFSQENQKK